MDLIKRRELLKNAMDRAVSEGEMAGCALCIAEEGEESLFLTSGYADIASGRRIARGDIYRMFSLTKPVTAAAFMKLAEDGFVDLCDPVGRYIESFRHQRMMPAGHCGRPVQDSLGIGKEGHEHSVPVPAGIGEEGRSPSVQGRLIPSDCETVPVPELHAMTIRDLLNMTSGLVYPDEVTLPGRETGRVMNDAICRLRTEHAMTTMEFADRIGACPLAFEPGSGWHYGVSADVLGAVAEKVTGEPFPEFVRETILEPCGMNDTWFEIPERERCRLVTSYQPCTEQNDNYNQPGTYQNDACHQPGADRNGASCVPCGLMPYTEDNLSIRNDGGPNPFASGGAGLFSTLDDYFRFTQMLLCGGTARNGREVLRPGTVRFLTSGGLSRRQQASFEKELPQLAGHTYANLSRVMLHPEQAVSMGHAGEYGWDGWMGTYYNNDPSAHRTILLMMNQTDYATGRLTRQIRNIVHSFE